MNAEDFEKAEQLIRAIRKRYTVSTKEQLFYIIKSKKVSAHPAWEDYVIWQNTEQDIKKYKTNEAK